MTINVNNSMWICFIKWTVSREKVWGQCAHSCIPTLLHTNAALHGCGALCSCYCSRGPNRAILQLFCSCGRHHLHSIFSHRWNQSCHLHRCFPGHLTVDIQLILKICFVYDLYFVQCTGCPTVELSENLFKYCSL